MHKLVKAMLYSDVNLIIPGRSTTRKEFVFSETKRILNASNLNKNAAGGGICHSNLKYKHLTFYIT